MGGTFHGRRGRPAEPRRSADLSPVHSLIFIGPDCLPDPGHVWGQRREQGPALAEGLLLEKVARKQTMQPRAN